MSTHGELREAVRRTVEATRTKLPPITGVAIRANVSRLASLSPRPGGSVTLNLAWAVVDAGEEAWRVVAPALEGDRASRDRLRALTRGGLGGARPRTPTPCQGSPEQQAFLAVLVSFLEESEAARSLFPEEVHFRISRAMTSALGRCERRGEVHRITIAERLFRSRLEPILWDTLKHEVAHLLDQATSPSGRSSHGRRWREWAERIGARPERRCRPEEALRIALAQGAPPGRPLRLPDEVEGWHAGRAGSGAESRDLGSGRRMTG